MKKVAFLAVPALFLFAVAVFGANAVDAGGDKVRGENGEGSTSQICVTPEYPEGDPDCPYGNYDPEE